jgi:hypothetical protein
MKKDHQTNISVQDTSAAKQGSEGLQRLRRDAFSPGENYHSTLPRMPGVGLLQEQIFRILGGSARYSMCECCGLLRPIHDYEVGRRL